MRLFLSFLSFFPLSALVTLGAGEPWRLPPAALSSDIRGDVDADGSLWSLSRRKPGIIAAKPPEDSERFVVSEIRRAIRWKFWVPRPFFLLSGSSGVADLESSKVTFVGGDMAWSFDDVGKATGADGSGGDPMFSADGPDAGKATGGVATLGGMLLAATERTEGAADGSSTT